MNHPWRGTVGVRSPQPVLENHVRLPPVQRPTRTAKHLQLRALDVETLPA